MKNEKGREGWEREGSKGEEGCRKEGREERVRKGEKGGG